MNAEPQPGATVEVTVEALGARGDGIAQCGGKRLFVPLAVPGDRLRVRIDAVERDGLRATAVARLSDGPGRAAAICGHFGLCGGCATQHLNAEAYGAWKTAMLHDALRHRGLATERELPLHRVAPGTRRRARFKARGGPGGGVALGFFAPSSHQVVDLAECPLLVPALADILPPLRAALAGMLRAGENAEIAATASDSGIDMVLHLARADDARRAQAIAFAAAADLARIAVREGGGGRGPLPPAEMLVQRRPVQVRFGGIAVNLPPDAFLQPTADGEAFLTDAVLAVTRGAKRIADLYAGCGAFGLPLLARGAHVHAADSAGDHVAAMQAAARAAGQGERLTAERRDLARRPLAGAELAGLDAVVLDPPRPGAPQQAAALAASPVPTVVYVSCNPASFARDGRVLADGGYRLESVAPLDQFVFAPHLELVGIFRKPRRRRGG